MLNYVHILLSFWNILLAIQDHKDCQEDCGIIIEYKQDSLRDSLENQEIAYNDSPINPESQWHISPPGSMTWTTIQVFEDSYFPKELVGTVNDIPFPQVPAKWYGNKTTGITFKSKLIQKISGFSFKGQIQPWNPSDKVQGNQNAFAIFYHELPDYKGGSEYGIVFRVDEKNIIFYTLTNANLPNQKWKQWPKQLASMDIQGNLIKAMLLASKIHEWSIKVTPEGDFIFSITDPKSGSTSTSKILKPYDFPNLYQTDGYITLAAHKFMNVKLNSNPHLKIEEIKVLQP